MPEEVILIHKHKGIEQGRKHDRKLREQTNDPFSLRDSMRTWYDEYINNRGEREPGWAELLRERLMQTHERSSAIRRPTDRDALRYYEWGASRSGTNRR